MWKCLSNPLSETRDVVICTVPWTDTTLPLMAPAALKPIVEKAGLSCLAIDLNMEVVNYTVAHLEKDKFIKFFFDEILHPDIEQETFEMLLNAAQGIVSYKPQWVGLSLFSYVCQTSAQWIAYFLKKIDPTIKIMVGGPGCLPNFTGPAPWVDKVISSGLVDYHIRGDGENSLYELLIGNTDYNGINDTDWKELSMDDLAVIPPPNYDDYVFESYQKKVLPLVGSRGCVRQCTFCDYIANWKKFQWRTADHIFEEMLLQNQRYHLRSFKFQDSLTNGNLKEFNRLIQLLADYNDENPDNSFNWGGYYIFREWGSNSEEEWSRVARSGANVLVVGIENFNEHIRYHMGKKFSNQAIDLHLEQAQKHNISLFLLNIVGYVTETQKDIEFIKEWLRTHTQYQDTIHLQWGGTLGIFPNTYLDNNKEKLGIIMLDKLPQYWTNKDNSTHAMRAKWVADLVKTSNELGYNVMENLDNHFILEKLLNG
jgi:hypothetical protein